MISATFLYSGFSDFWGGDGDRWDDNKGCLFAYYNHNTTLRDLIDQWVDDFYSGGDCDTFPEEVTENDIRAALLDMLSEQGLADYNDGSLCEFAIEYGEINGLTEDDDDDDCMESPVAIVLIEVDVCSECGKADDHYTDDLCADCTKKHYGSITA